jgi:hypothetical protein
MNEIEIFIRFSFLGLSTIISIISLVSFVKTKEIKLAFASIGFLLLMLEGILVSIGVFSQDVEYYNTIGIFVGITFFSLIFLYLSILKQ